MSDAPDPVALGGDLTYTAAVRNNGNLQATGATLADALPAGASLASAAAGQGSCSGTATPAAALRRVAENVAENAPFSSGEKDRAFVLMQYFGQPRRDPADPPDSDFSGYDFWLSKLSRFNGNFVSAEMVKAFITSIEYRQRFGRGAPPVESQVSRPEVQSSKPGRDRCDPEF